MPASFARPRGELVHIRKLVRTVRAFTDRFGWPSRMRGGSLGGAIVFGPLLRLGIACAAACLLPEHAWSEGRTVIDVSLSYHHVRKRPTYDGNVRASFSGTIILSGKNRIETSATGSSGKYRYNDGSQSSLGERNWRIAGSNQIQRVWDWPQSTFTITVVTHKNGCRLMVSERLKPGFTEYKLPMLSANEFGYYGPRTITNTSCSIRNE